MQRVLGFSGSILVVFTAVLHVWGDDRIATAERIPGALVIVGGGMVTDEIRQTFFDLAGGEEAKLVVIPTASRRDDIEEDDEQFLAQWSELGAKSLTLLHTRDREKASSSEFAEPIREATGVWFGGGLQSRIAAAYLDTPVEEEVQQLLARGGVVGGTSAGAAIQSRTMIAGGNPRPRMATGFDLLTGAIVDQHFSERKRHRRLRRAVNDHPHLFGVGIDESTALVVEGSTMKTVGEGSVWLMLARFGDQPTTLEVCAGESANLGAWQQMARERAEALQADSDGE